jgi:anti-sigma regulatory factor (Ser/Thr protein kinase)
VIEVRTILTPHPTSVGAARRFVRDVLKTRQVDDSVVTIVELLTSEVVTNAIIHARSGPQLAVELHENRVRVAVRDLSPEIPLRRRGHVEDTTGRGVIIVEELATAWGVDRERNGTKRVWFEVAC